MFTNSPKLVSEGEPKSAALIACKSVLEAA